VTATLLCISRPAPLIGARSQRSTSCPGDVNRTRIRSTIMPKPSKRHAPYPRDSRPAPTVECCDEHLQGAAQAHRTTEDHGRPRRKGEDRGGRESARNVAFGLGSKCAQRLRRQARETEKVAPATLALLTVVQDFVHCGSHRIGRWKAPAPAARGT